MPDYRQLQNFPMPYQPLSTFDFQGMQQFHQPQFQQPQPQFQPQPQAVNPFRVRPVANFEEAVASPIDYGTFNLYVNSGKGEIYLTKINNDGGKDIATFILKEEQARTQPTFDLLNEKLDAILIKMEANNGIDSAGNTGGKSRTKPDAVAPKPAAE